MKALLFVCVLATLPAMAVAREGSLEALNDLLKEKKALVPPTGGPDVFEVFVDHYPEVKDKNFGRFLNDAIARFLRAQKELTGFENPTFGDLLTTEWQIRVYAKFNDKDAQKNLLYWANPKIKEKLSKLLANEAGIGNHFYHLQLVNEAAEPIGADLFVIRSADGRDGNDVIVIQIGWALG